MKNATPAKNWHLSKSCTPTVRDSAKKKQYRKSGISDKGKRYAHSDRSINLSEPCRYCNYPRGLIIIRWRGDLGFVKCGRCDAALFSLNESKPKQGLQHIGEILDNYLPNGEVGK